MPICKLCNKSLPVEMFYSKSIGTHLDLRCKTCKSQQSKLRKRSIDGLIDDIYIKQRSNSKQRGHSMPSYSKQELKDFLLSNNQFNNLYLIWTKSNFNLDKRPSIDRIYNNKSYTIDNIQLLTFRQNMIRPRKPRLLL